MDSQAHPLPHGLSWSSLLCSVRLPRDTPLFSPTGVLVDLDRGAVQHQRCFVHQILPNQGCADIFPYPSFCPGTEPAVHALPWLEPLRQIPPWYSGVQPLQNCVEHFPVASSRPAPCGFLSGGNRCLILFHCFSLISCLFTCFILSFQHFTYNPLVLKQTLNVHEILQPEYLVPGCIGVL